MKKASLAALLIVPVAVAAGIFGASAAHAQVYSYTTGTYGYPTNAYGSSCLTLTNPLTIGSNDSTSFGQVSELQNFLAREGLFSSALITGYYGPITAGAVSQFQAAHGIQPTGVVGPLTRAAIQQTSCGNTSIISPAQPINPNYPYGYNNNGYGNYSYIELNSLAASYQNGSTIITLSGYGFDPLNNTVEVGNTSISGVSSNNGSTLQFTLPNLSAGTYPITVTTSRGTSNSLSYTVSGNCNGVVYQTYPYTYNNSNNCTCNTSNNNYYYNNGNQYSCPNQPYNNGSIQITSLSANSGSAGSQVTIYGSGFTTYNTVYFGGTSISNVYSNGSSVSFTVPYINNNYNSGNYTVYVTNQNGQSSNSVNFTINGSSYSNGSINLSYVSPNSANPNTQVIIYGNGFTQYGNTIYFDGIEYQNQSSNNGTSIYFTVPNIGAGTYTLYVTNQNNQNSNSVSLQVL